MCSAQRTWWRAREQLEIPGEYSDFTLTHIRRLTAVPLGMTTFEDGTTCTARNASSNHSPRIRDLVLDSDWESLREELELNEDLALTALSRLMHLYHTNQFDNKKDRHVKSLFRCIFFLTVHLNMKMNSFIEVDKYVRTYNYADSFPYITE